MRKVALVLFVVIVATVFGAGVARASGYVPQSTIHCRGGQCSGTNGSDTLIGTSGRDVIYAFRNRDTVRGAGGSDELYGDPGRDMVVGGTGNDEIDGGSGADRLYGGGGIDDIYGGFQNDVIVGGPGPDTLYGGNGNDTIDAKDGVSDIVDCGYGTGDVAVVDRGIDHVSGDCEKIYFQTR